MHWLERTALGGFWIVAAIALFGIASTGGVRGAAFAAERAPAPVRAAGVEQLAAARCSEALALLRASESPLAALSCFASAEAHADAAAPAAPADVRLPGAPLGDPDA